MGVQTLRCLGQVRFTDDVVAVEDRARFMTGQSHGYPFRHSCPDHIADGTAAEVMDDKATDAGGIACIAPGLSKVTDWPALPVEHALAISRRLAVATENWIGAVKLASQ